MFSVYPLLINVFFFLIVNECWILSNAFSPSTEMILCFSNFSFFKKNGVLHWLICIYWTLFINLGWIPVGHGIWSFFVFLFFSPSVMSDSLWTAACQASLPFAIIWSWLKSHVHWVNNTIQPCHPLSYASLPAFNLPQHQGLFQWVSSSY